MDDDGSGSTNFMDGIQSMGIVNALKTGNVHIDMIVAMLIPVVLRIMFSFVNGQSLQDLVHKIKEYFDIDDDDDDYELYYDRTLTHVEGGKRNQVTKTTLEEDVKNEILVKAVLMYLQHKNCLKFQDAELKLTTMQVDFKDPDESDDSDDDSDSYDSDDGYDDWLSDSDYSSSEYDSSDDDDGTEGSDGANKKEANRYSSKLASYKMVHMPPEEEWHSIGLEYPNKRRKPPSQQQADAERDGQGTAGETNNEDQDEDEQEEWHGIEMHIEEDDGEEENDNKNNKNRRTVHYSFRSRGEESVDLFLEDAYQWYIDEIKKSEDKTKSRYYYDMKDLDYGPGDVHEYKRYKLSDDKSFNSLFFQERDMIVKLLDNFIHKTGKYAIEGYPYKLGLLLHGPPGTGKTSLIKAIAQYTKRSIVNIPLARIQTNDELNRLFFGNTFHYDGSSYPAIMNFKDVIFVMEDVDAASKVVQRRDGKRTATATQTGQISLPVPKSLWRLLLESQGEDCEELVDTLVEESERLKEDAISSGMLTSLAKRLTRSIPGMAVVGHAMARDQKGAATLKQMAQDALQEGEEMIEACESLDEYLDFHAKSILQLLEHGAEVNQEFEDVMMGLASGPTTTNVTMDDDSDDDESHAPRKPKRPRGALTRDVSYSKYNLMDDDDDNMDLLELDTIDKSYHALTELAAMQSMSSPMIGGGLEFGGGEFGPGGGGGFGFGGSIDDISLGVGGGDGDIMGPKGMGGMMSLLGGGGGRGFGPLRDELNLSGLLNVLDGVVDTPGRIMIMTSNHPEKLDAALIRPGRIDKKLTLGYMHAEDVVNMLQHYFQLELDDIQKSRVCAAVQGAGTSEKPALCLTPAQVEQMTAEYDDIQDMIDALEQKGKPIIVQNEDTTMTQAESAPGGTVSGGGRPRRSSAITYDGS